MRRLALLLGLLALVVALPATHTVLAKATKVDVCHVNSANQPAILSYDYLYDYYYLNKISGYSYESHYDYTRTTTYHLGRVISVDNDAVAAHLAHGDAVYYNPLPDSMVAYLEALEDNYSDSEYQYEYDSSSFYYSYSYSYDYNNQNAVIKNADCYFLTSETVYH